MKLTLDITAADGSARTGTVATSRGAFRTPIFMPVATKGTIRSLMTHDLAALSAADGTAAEVVLGNTYHLMLRPGADVVADLGGLHRFVGWDRLMLTDSGGYQVFSLEPKLHDGGAEFRSTYDGSTHLLTPEGAVATQELLGADIQMVLDVCAPLPSSREVLRDARRFHVGVEADELSEARHILGDHPGLEGIDRFRRLLEGLRLGVQVGLARCEDDVAACGLQPGAVSVPGARVAIKIFVWQELQDTLLAIFDEERTLCFFVTHDTEEAVYLADRILIMSAHGEIREDVGINLPRPRDRYSSEVTELVKRINSIAWQAKS